MTGKIPPEKAGFLLEMPTERTPEDLDLKRQWNMYFLIFGGVTVLAVFMLINNIMDGNRPLWHALLCLGGTIFLDMLVFGKYYRARILAPARFKAALKKYGMNELTAQINDPTTQGFFILSKVYENILVILRIISLPQMNLSIILKTCAPYRSRNYMSKKARSGNRKASTSACCSAVVTQ